MDSYWSPRERAGVEHMLRYAMVGSPEIVGDQLMSFIDQTGVDELMLTGQIYDHQARVHAYEIAAELRDSLSTD
jgi:alkanesulfonate monooxygenase SsuD/methylene tetrahydromethanopterin reductase-like flavin-dependent oxidoreductase (luciferase family)